MSEKKDVEIDAVIPSARGVWVYEVKYRKLTESEAVKLINNLKKKASLLAEPVEGLGLVLLNEPMVKGVKIWSLESLLSKALKARKITLRIM